MEAAARIIRRYYQESSDRGHSKGDASPVTLADREAESAIRRIISDAFPGDGLWGEEYGRTFTNAQRTWIIDPIDGTQSFLCKKPLFTTLLAVTHTDGIELGLIHQPILNQTWKGFGRQTLLNHAPCATSTITELSQAIIATTAPQYFSHPQLQLFTALASSCRFCHYGGDAYNYGQLASGHIDLVVEAGLQPHDYAALIAVVEGAGGVITDWQGRPLVVDGIANVLAAANRTLHEKALRLLAGG